MSNLTLGEVLSCEGGSIKTGPFGTALKAAEYSEVGVPVISVGEVGQGALRVHAKTPRADEDTTSRLPEYLLRAGDIVFGRKGAVSRSAWVKRDEDGYFLGSDGIRVRFEGAIDSRFMAYQFQTSVTRDWLEQHAAGTTMASLNQRILERVPVTLPALAEQRAIAEVLGALDDKIAANDSLVTTADLLAAALIRARVGDKQRPLLDVAALTMGLSPPGTSYNEDGRGVVFYQGVRDFGVRYPSNRIWTDEPVRLSVAGDTLLSVRAPVGRTNLAAEETCIGRGLASLRSKSHAAMTLFHLLRDAPGIWAPYEAEGTVFGSINRRQLEALLVPVVAPGKADKLEDELAAIEGRIASAIAESSILAKTRDELLPLVISGRVRVKDAERIVEEAL